MIVIADVDLPTGAQTYNDGFSQHPSVFESAALSHATAILPIFERKADSYFDPYFALNGSMRGSLRGMQIYQYYLPDPVHESSPTLLDRKVSDNTNKKSGSPPERRSRSFDQKTFAKKPPLSTLRKPIINKQQEKAQPQPPKQPRPRFTRKLGKVDSNVSGEKEKTEKKPQNRAPTVGARNQTRASAIKEKIAPLNSTQIKRDTVNSFITPTFSPGAYHRDAGLRNPDSHINFEDPKNLQPCLKKKPKPTFKLILPSAGGSRRMSPHSPREVSPTKVQSQPDYDNRSRATNPIYLNSSGIHQAGTFESKEYSSNFSVNSHIKT